MAVKTGGTQMAPKQQAGKRRNTPPPPTLFPIVEKEFQINGTYVMAQFKEVHALPMFGNQRSERTTVAVPGILGMLVAGERSDGGVGLEAQAQAWVGREILVYNLDHFSTHEHAPEPMPDPLSQIGLRIFRSPRPPRPNPTRSSLGEWSCILGFRRSERVTVTWKSSADTEGLENGEQNIENQRGVYGVETEDEHTHDGEGHEQEGVFTKRGAEAHARGRGIIIH
ncbi:hypothetical protein DFH09DRAFT_1072444 [Mycena vulgaris]|nr:hypothetical protein DFH09DRAFT_1072444 [Mycena vulgaris]